MGYPSVRVPTWLGYPPPGPGWGTPPPPGPGSGTPPPLRLDLAWVPPLGVDRQADACQNITFPRTMYAVCNYLCVAIC